MQVREIARLSVHEKEKDFIISVQDSNIYDLRSKIDNHNLAHLKKDSIISNHETILANKDTIHSNSIKVCEIEKKQLKKANKKLWIVVVAEAILITILVL